jgi:hypothetical protein
LVGTDSAAVALCDADFEAAVGAVVLHQPKLREEAAFTILALVVQRTATRLPAFLFLQKRNGCV